MSYQKMMLILNQYEGVDLHLNSKGDGFRFPVYLNDRYKEVGVDSLELSERSSNCLKRAGYKNLYDLFINISGRTDLLKIRNLGAKSSREIMEQIFIFQYLNLKPEQRDRYINRIIEMNCK